MRRRFQVRPATSATQSGSAQKMKGRVPMTTTPNRHSSRTTQARRRMRRRPSAEKESGMVVSGKRQKLTVKQ